MTVTASKIDEAVEDHSGGWMDVNWMDKDETFALLIDGEAVTAKKVDNSRLGTGATDIWVVIEVDGRLFRKTGYYQSYDGSYWDGAVQEVVSAQKLVTVYERA
jgi:hypothetical protein